MSTLVIAVLAAFTALTVLHQIRPLQRYLQKFDTLGLLPNYSFFAPRPLTSDYRLVYKRAAEEDGEWIEIPIYAEARVLRLLWNPGKYVNKAFVDTSNFLVAEFHALSRKTLIQVSLHYLALLSTVARHSRQANGRSGAVRFAVITTAGGERTGIERVVFASFPQSL